MSTNANVDDSRSGNASTKYLFSQQGCSFHSPLPTVSARSKRTFSFSLDPSLANGNASFPPTSSDTRPDSAALAQTPLSVNTQRSIPIVIRTRETGVSAAGTPGTPTGSTTIYARVVSHTPLSSPVIDSRPTTEFISPLHSAPVPCASSHVSPSAPPIVIPPPREPGGPEPLVSLEILQTLEDNPTAAVCPGKAAAAVCDACPQCDDTCQIASCDSCNIKRKRLCQSGQTTFTMCQVRRHNRAEDCWLATKCSVYDVTAFLSSGKHPGGARSILRKAGTDVTDDFNFHSKSGQKYVL
jgi:predicted heme/steroid binding protein